MPPNLPKCDRCKHKLFPISRCYWAYEYGGAIQKAIGRLKYNGLTHIASKLGQLHRGMGRKLSYDTVIPVPLHKGRLRQRGFNQSALIAKVVSQQVKAKLECSAIVRVRKTQPQVGLSASARKANLRSAFISKRLTHITNKNVLIVDDVSTTGATLNSCARVLLKAGASSVSAWTVAREI